MPRNIYQKAFYFLLAYLFLLPITAQNMSPVGYWQTISDITNRPAGVVQITEKDGVLYGKIVAIFEQDGNKSTDRCVKCPGDFYNKPIMGLPFMWGFRQDDDEWTGGQILDPKTGKTYHCKLRVYDEGRYMKVRGYIGIPLFGRTQIWVRTERRK